MSRVERQARLHNAEMRNVNYEHSYKFSSFLERARGNILINGGTKGKRRLCLLEYIVCMSANTCRPIIIFSDDDTLEENLIRLAENGMIGKLQVCSEKRSKYDFFCGMQNRFISECMTRIASAKGCRDTTEPQSYINAFLAIMKDTLSGINSRRGPDLNIMLENAGMQDSDLIAVAKSPLNASVLNSSTQGGVLFRSLLQIFADETSDIRNTNSNYNDPEDNALTIKNCIKNQLIFLIKVPPVNCEILSVYFATELRSLIDNDFLCIFDDSLLLETESMQTVVSMMKKRSNIDVICSCDNILSFDHCDKDIEDNFNSNLIFLNGNAPQQDIQKVLSSFGQYTHMKAMTNISTPPRIFLTLARGEGESAQAYARDRVLLQEEYGKEAVITYGSNAHIVIVENLMNNL